MPLIIAGIGKLDHPRLRDLHWAMVLFMLHFVDELDHPGLSGTH